MSIGIPLSAASLAVRPRPAILRALGVQDLPVAVEVRGETYQLVETFKHDTWAATGLYAAADRRIVCKFNRERHIFYFPGRIIGSWLAGQERSVMQRLAGIQGIPAELGPVTVTGIVRPNAVARTFIPGEILTGQKMSAEFFGRLRSLLEAMHARGVAYTDLHKTENVLVGQDGKPYLFDFQISQMQPRGVVGWLPLMRWGLWCLQQSDLYHLQKHVSRLQANRDEAASSCPMPWWIRLHRLIAIPWRTLRRRLLVAARIRSGAGAATSEAYPEMGFRSQT